jgi:hypothetical protein
MIAKILRSSSSFTGVLLTTPEAGEDERTRANYVAMIPQMRARWKGWQGDDSLYEMVVRSRHHTFSLCAEHV